MATVILVRHGRTKANDTGVLAGRLAGVRLDTTGEAQAREVGERLAAVRLSAVATSPLERCRQTARAITSRQPEPVEARPERQLTECDYGDWQGRPLRELAREKLWKVVQSQPSAVTFPGGEAMGAMQGRAVSAVRRLDAQVHRESGAGAVWAAVSHGDVIKAILADALGTHLDHFQRIQVDPASVSIIRFTEARPYVLAMNTHAGDLSWLSARRRRGREARDADVGGGAGPALPRTP